MNKNTVENKYFEWLYNIVCGDRFSDRTSYRKLMTFLHTKTFKYTIAMDKNRAEDGIDLRYRFSLDTGCYADDIEGPCSILEMMVALAIRCEECIMDDTKYGNRTGQWFWGMINSLGLGAMIDSNFDKIKTINIIDNFLSRNYAPNGKGGLFTIRNCEKDLRDVEIWCQLNWYLSSII